MEVEEICETEEEWASRRDGHPAGQGEPRRRCQV
eukprot:CAMPEP_0113989052 /NCGR_PEP_ID=MMETSP0328-20130328/7833_1 /TAXON_ID=39455 /ORGANISM="Alexandrium minutum" /LENGTH=33 /assembly_acc=CAM_ASM_000350